MSVPLYQSSAAGKPFLGAPLASFNSDITSNAFDPADGEVAFSGQQLSDGSFAAGVQGIAQGNGAFAFYGLSSYTDNTGVGAGPYGAFLDTFFSATVDSTLNSRALGTQLSLKPSTGKTMSGLYVGQQSAVGNIGLGTVLRLSAFLCEVDNLGGGTVAEGYGYDAHNSLVTGATKTAAFHAEDQGSGATHYGILLEGVTHNDLGGGVTKVGSLAIPGAGSGLATVVAPSAAGTPTLTLPTTTGTLALVSQLAQTLANVSHKWLNSYNSTTGLFTQTQPAESDLSFTDITTNDVSTSAHGFAPKAPNDAAKYLDGTGAYSNPVKVLFASAANTDTLSANSGTQNFATTYTIPANYLVANKLIRVSLGFSITSSGATIPTVGFSLTIGGTLVFQSAGITPTGSLTKIPLGIQFLIGGTAAASASSAVAVNDLPGYGVSASGMMPFNAPGAANSQPVNLATNGTMVIQPRYTTNNSTAGNSITLMQFVVEALN